MQTETVLVTGASGFLARRVMELLLRDGTRVIGLTRAPVADLPLTVEPFIADIRDPVSTMEAVARSGFVMHLASIVGNASCEADPETAVNVNVDGTLNILDAVRFFKKPALFASVGNAADNNLYAITKSTAERFCLMYNREFSTSVLPVRIFNTYGPGQSRKSGKLIATNIHNALSGKELTMFGDGEQKDDYIYVDDVAALIVNLFKSRQWMDSPPQEAIHIGTGTATSVKTVLETIVKLTGTTSKIVSQPARAGSVMRESIAAIGKLVKPDGFRYTALEEGLQRTITAMKKELGK